ncbi:MAG: TonB-dependent receptor [Ferruginibacter sp.]
MFTKIFCGIVLLLIASDINGQANITGNVTDHESNPLRNVSIHLLNTHVTTISDAAGNFNIHNLGAGEYIIELTAIGYATAAEAIDVKKKDNKSFIFQLQNSLIQLETVTVTSEKKEELLQKVPVSVTAISSRQVQEFRLWNTKELTAIVPNMSSGNSGDERNVTSIRGITTTSYDPAVATYIDGVNQFNLDTYIPQLSDIERIEVLRGPQGTLYGRNAMGGVINIITKQPTNSTNGFVELSVGNFNQQRYSTGIRTPVVKNKLFLGASGVFNKRNGYYNNQFNNKSFDKQEQVTGNYYLKYLPAAKWSITLNIKHQNNSNMGAFPMVNGVEEAFSQPFELNQNAVGKMIDNTLNASLSVNHIGALVDFSTQLAWQTNHRIYESPIDGDFSPLDAVTIVNNYGNPWNNVKVLTHEFRFNSAAGKSSLLSWTAGTYFFHQDNPVKQGTHFGKDAALLGVPDTDFSTINITKGRNTGFAVYGQINYMLTSKLSLIAGMRYDYENKRLNVNGEYQKDGQDAFVTRDDTSASVHFNAVSPKLGLKYQIAGNSNLYASYGRGFRTGGLTQLSSDPSQPPLYPYKPEYSNNIEVGIKNNFFKNRLFLNVSAFLTYVNNAQVPTLILPDAITVTRNTGELRSKGAELELSCKPVKGFQLDYSLGYTDAKYKSLKVSGNGQTVNLDGKKQIFTPDVTSMLVLQYSYLVSARQQIKLVARGEWYYLGRRYFDLGNNIQQSPYNLLNARLGISSKHADLFFWVRNCTNKNYIEYAYDFGAVHLAAPRTYGLTIKTQF